MLQRLAERSSRAHPLAVGSCVFVLLLALRWSALADPPYWDALMGAFPQALWLAEHHFDVWGLLTTQPVYTQGGPNVYPFSIYPLFAGALYAAGLSRTLVFVVLHVVSVASAAAAAGSLYSVAQRRLPPPAAILLVCLFVSAPLCQSLASQMNMDMPLVAATALSFSALDQKKFRCAALWALVGLLIKPTAVILIGANLVVCVLLAWRPRWCGFGAEAAQPDERARARNGAWLHAALLVLFCVQVLLLARFASAPAYVDPFGGWKRLFGRVVWMVPEFGLALVVFLVSAPLLVKRMLAGRARWIQVQCGVFLAAFLLFYGQYTNPLPRYFLQAYPHLLMWLALALHGSEAHVAVRRGLLTIAVLYHVLNWSGGFYPARPSGWQVPGVANEIPGNDGYILERSMEYREDLLLDLKLARALERMDRERTVVVANWPLLHLLAFPELGYLDDTRGWRTSSSDNPLVYDPNSVDFRTLYALEPPPPRKTTPLDVVWALSPNTFSGPQSSFRAEIDVVLDTVSSGERRAFLVRRKGWE